MEKKAKRIISQPLHALPPEFSPLPSGHRFMPSRRSHHFSTSFISSAIKLFNSDRSPKLVLPDLFHDSPVT